jgi:biotin-dependent carboxylase-like uncharacterized protein
MDRLAFATANRVVGAADDAAAIEVSVGGLEVTAEGAPVPVALAGGSFALRLDGQPLPSAVRLALAPGATLSVRPGRSGAWCYLALGGKLDVKPVMGSVSTHTRSGIGGLFGRALVSGDVLPLTGLFAAHPGPCEVVAPHLGWRDDAIRVVLGPQHDHFSGDQIEAFLDREWTVSTRADRMAYCLKGQPIKHARSFNIVSDGIPRGAVQVPGDGRPIVLMADRQPTGGYPKLATVIGPDVGRLAQLRPGSRFKFAAVSTPDAVAACRDQYKVLQRRVVIRPILRAHLPSEFLLDHNLIAGVSSVEDPSQDN